MTTKLYLRGFEEVPTQFKQVENETTILPVRGDARSAGYDFYSKETVTIPPHQSHLFWTDVCAYMQDNEVLLIHVRSSIGVKKGLMLKNTTGVIDSSYYANPSNYGNIGICLYNNSDKPVVIEAQERIAQGVFQNYLVTDEDSTLHMERSGGFGSSNR
jgi:dUTP pyrophosphatase